MIANKFRRSNMKLENHHLATTDEIIDPGKGH